MLYIYIINHLNKPWHHQAQRFLRPPKILLLALGHGGQHQAVLDHLQGLSSFEKDKTMEKPRKNHGKSMFLGFFEFFWGGEHEDWTMEKSWSSCFFVGVQLKLAHQYWEPPENFISFYNKELTQQKSWNIGMNTIWPSDLVSLAVSGTHCTAFQRVFMVVVFPTSRTTSPDSIPSTFDTLLTEPSKK